MPRVHQVLPSLGFGDAIGNEVLGIQRALVSAGHDSEIYVEAADSRLEHLTRDYRDLPTDVRPEDVVIHHFSIGSRASRTAYAVPSRMLFVYHNITPPQYFLGEHGWLVRQCYHGRRELGAYRSRVDLALGDSEYNRAELDALGFAPTGVLPPLADLTHLDVSPDPRVFDAWDDDHVNILFVGRITPNKRPDHLIRHVHTYRRMFGRPVRLLLAGSHTHFENYRDEVQAFAARLGATDIEMLGQVTNEELTALYDVADVFLCASEHEGFCVPLLEAFYKRVPVIALAATAVPATMDGGGVLYERDDSTVVAGLIEAVVSDEALEDRILAAQDAALARFLAKDFAGTLLGHVNQVLAAPIRTTVPVTADFWRQVELAAELDEIREARPSAFHALPAAPADARLIAHVGYRP
jgi:glycosyltransferase involved in cell wall biosynthesis